MLIIVKVNHGSGDRVGLKQVLQGKEFVSGGLKILFYSKESLKFGDILSKIIKGRHFLQKHIIHTQRQFYINLLAFRLWLNYYPFSFIGVDTQIKLLGNFLK